MRRIVYYVASSLDGFISGLNDDISAFAQGGLCVEQYLSDLQSFNTVIMGRNTYEFGYKYGLEPGQPAYPHMKHFIFSNNLSFENPHEQVQVQKLDSDFIRDLKGESGSDIYLCGGGVFSGWLLKEGLIDEIKLKLNPIVLGDGCKLFGDNPTNARFMLRDSKSYDDGMQLLTYQINT